MIAIVDYGLGNLTSVKNALDTLGVENRVTALKKDIVTSKGIILPGVGAAGVGMLNLRKKKLDSLLIEQIKRGKPFLGTCLGMQLLFEYSEEDNTKCLGILRGKVKKFQTKLKVPQIGWNNVRITNYPSRRGRAEADELRITNEIKDNSYFYYVNSYYCIPEDKNTVVGTTEYGVTFASVIQKDNIYATQFHSEKSGEAGLQLLKNFCSIAEDWIPGSPPGMTLGRPPSDRTQGKQIL